MKDRELKETLERYEKDGILLALERFVLEDGVSRHEWLRQRSVRGLATLRSLTGAEAKIAKRQHKRIIAAAKASAARIDLDQIDDAARKVLKAVRRTYPLPGVGSDGEKIAQRLGEFTPSWFAYQTLLRTGMIWYRLRMILDATALKAALPPKELEWLRVAIVDAIQRGIGLGRLLEHRDFKVRWESEAKAGQQVRAARARANAQRQRDQQDRHKSILAFADRLRAQDVPVKAIEQRIRERFGVSRSTFYRAQKARPGRSQV